MEGGHKKTTLINKAVGNVVNDDFTANLHRNKISDF